MAFFVLQIGGVEQYRYAWFEAAGTPNYGSAPDCPACHRAVGMREWLPPHVVALRQTKHLGDFLHGAGACPFLCQARVVERWRAHELRGMDRLYPISVSRMRTIREANDSPWPALFGVDVPHSLAPVEHDRMNVEWTQLPDAEHCRTCGPGGGGRGASSAVGNELSLTSNHGGVTISSSRSISPVRFCSVSAPRM